MFTPHLGPAPRRLVLSGCLLVAVTFAGCSEERVAPAPDISPPAAVTDLAVLSFDDTSATLTWTAPGDDDTTGTAVSYDVRHATSLITAGTWNSATQASGEPVPRAGGARDTMVVTGLAPGPRWFAMRTIDDADNVSAMSNVVSISGNEPGRPVTRATGTRGSRRTPR